MSATEDMTPQEAAQTMRRWADAVESVFGSTEGQDEHTADAIRRAEAAEARVEKLERERGTSALRSISGEIGDLAEELAAARSQRDTARAEAEQLRAALDGAAEECEELHGETERLRAELEDLRATTPRTVRPSGVQTGQAVAWFSVEDMQWRVRRIKSGPDAVGFSISQMFNPHQKVVILGEPPRELDQDEGDAEADDWAHRQTVDVPVPDEPDAVIEVVEFNGAPMTPQLAQKLGRQAGRPFWWSLVSGDAWPDGSEVADPEEITGWRWPAEGGGDQ